MRYTVETIIRRFTLMVVTLIMCSGCTKRRCTASTDMRSTAHHDSSDPAAVSMTYIPLRNAADAVIPTVSQKNSVVHEQIADHQIHALRKKMVVDAIAPTDSDDDLILTATKTVLPADLPVEERYVKIDFENEELGTVIQHFASLQHYNILLPQGAQALSQKITFKLPYEIPIKEVNRYIDLFLELVGYSRVPHGAFMRIVKNDAQVVREILPLYVVTNPALLPQSEERIRAIFYLKNLRVPESAQGTEPITIMLNDILSPSRSYMYDSRTNAIIVSDKSSNIRAALTLINNLDVIGTRDIVRVIPLYNASADLCAQLINSQILAASGEDQQVDGRDVGRYFAAGIRVQPDERTNALVVMGRESAVERLQDFVREYIDIPADSGNSILHMYPLQYLDAERFAPILQKIVNEQGIGGSNQAKQGTQTGPYRFFDGVVVVAEKIIAERVEEKKLASQGTESVLKGTVYRGGNRILVTALSSDWKRIERLIKELDKPRLQVVLQTMIVDFDVNDNKILGAQTRNPSWMQLPPGVSFQAAHLTTPILNGVNNPSPPPTFINPTTLAADLLRLLTGGLSAAGQLINSGNNIANIGSTILSFNDTSPFTPGIWSFLQWLNSFGAVKVLSNPHIIVLNNGRGEELISDIQRLPGPAETGEGGAIAIKQVDVEAALKISVVPRASSVDRLSLQISIIINQFEGTAGARTTREIHTNVNLNSGETLVIGGLTRYQESDAFSETPILGRIPLLKWLFSTTKKTLTKTNLIVFISPTIIEPRIRDQQDAFTKDIANRNYDLLRNNEFAGQLKEPVSYLFFGSRTNEMMTAFDEYLTESVGDFVFENTSKSGRPTSYRCADDTDADQDTQPTVQSVIADDTTDAAQLKRALSNADNPLAIVEHAPK